MVEVGKTGTGTPFVMQYRVLVLALLFSPSRHWWLQLLCREKQRCWWVPANLKNWKYPNRQKMVWRWMDQCAAIHFQSLDQNISPTWSAWIRLISHLNSPNYQCDLKYCILLFISRSKQNFAFRVFNFLSFKPNTRCFWSTHHSQVNCQVLLTA